MNAFIVSGVKEMLTFSVKGLLANFALPHGTRRPEEQWF